MSAQYSEGSSAGSAAGNYSALDAYDRAVPTPAGSEMTYIPSPDELKYLNMNRQENIKLPLFIADNYATLETSGQFTAIPLKKVPKPVMKMRMVKGPNGMKKEYYMEATNFMRE